MYPTPVLPFDKRPTPPPGLSFSTRINTNFHNSSISQSWDLTSLFQITNRIIQANSPALLRSPTREPGIPIFCLQSASAHMIEECQLFALPLPNLVCQQYFVGLAHMTTIVWELPPAIYMCILLKQSTQKFASNVANNYCKLNIIWKRRMFLSLNGWCKLCQRKKRCILKLEKKRENTFP